MSSETLPEWEPEKTRGNNSKLLIGLGIGCGGILLLCCGGLTFSGFMAQRWAKDSFSDDPVVVREHTDQIATINLPEVLQPRGSIDMKIPFTDEPLMRMVIYESDGKQGTFVMAEFDHEMFGEEQQDEMALQIKESLNKQGKNQQEITVQHSEPLELTVRGQPASFVLDRGTANDSEVEMWQVRGTFRSKQGIAFFMLVIEADQMSQEEIIEMIESIE